mgnify:CR=1 FL=1
MNDALEILSIALGVAIVFSVPFGFFTLWRFLRYRETVALAKEGLLPPQRRGGGGGDLLRWGVVVAIMGFGLTLGLWPLGAILDPQVVDKVPLGLGPWMLIGILPMFLGLALIVLHFINQHLEGEVDEVDTAVTDDPIPPHKQV